MVRVVRRGVFFFLLRLHLEHLAALLLRMRSPVCDDSVMRARYRQSHHIGAAPDYLNIQHRHRQPSSDVVQVRPVCPFGGMLMSRCPLDVALSINLVGIVVPG